MHVLVFLLAPHILVILAISHTYLSQGSASVGGGKGLLNRYNVLVEKRLLDAFSTGGGRQESGQNIQRESR